MVAVAVHVELSLRELSDRPLQRQFLLQELPPFLLLELYPNFLVNPRP